MNEFARRLSGFDAAQYDPRSEDPMAVAAPMGMITRGSLLKGLQLRLEHGTTVEDMRVGRFVVIEGEQNRFFCMVTDMELGSANDRVLLDPPTRAHPLVAEMLEDIATFGTVSIQPMLMLPRVAAAPEWPPARVEPDGGATGRQLEPV